MTPDEILSAVYEAMEVSEVSYGGLSRAREIIAAAIREAVAAERERCAKVAEAEGIRMYEAVPPDVALEVNPTTALMAARQVAARIREGTT